MMRTEPAKKRGSIKLGASFGLPALAACLWTRSLAVMKVAMKVTQLTMGTAIERSDFATKKLLKIEAA